MTDVTTNQKGDKYIDSYLSPMRIDWSKIEAVILDLGGVILDIDYHLTINAFKDLGISNFEDQYSKKVQSGLFDLLETGKISASEFYHEMRTVNTSMTDEQIQQAWNAMLLDFPHGRLEFLQQIKKRYPLFLLSNTNEIHLTEFTKTLQRHGHGNLSLFFDKVYLSHEIGQRKPNREAFELILKEQGLTPENTLFVDDSEQHITGARSIDIQAYHLEAPETLEQLFSPVLA